MGQQLSKFAWQSQVTTCQGLKKSQKYEETKEIILCVFINMKCILPVCLSVCLSFPLHLWRREPLGSLVITTSSPSPNIFHLYFSEFLSVICLLPPWISSYVLCCRPRGCNDFTS